MNSTKMMKTGWRQLVYVVVFIIITLQDPAPEPKPKTTEMKKKHNTKGRIFKKLLTKKNQTKIIVWSFTLPYCHSVLSPLLSLLLLPHCPSVFLSRWTRNNNRIGKGKNVATTAIDRETGMKNQREKNDIPINIIMEREKKNFWFFLIYKSLLQFLRCFYYWATWADTGFLLLLSNIWWCNDWFGSSFMPWRICTYFSYSLFLRVDRYYTFFFSLFFYGEFGKKKKSVLDHIFDFSLFLSSRVRFHRPFVIFMNQSIST